MFIGTFLKEVLLVGVVFENIRKEWVRMAVTEAEKAQYA